MFLGCLPAQLIDLYQLLSLVVGLFTALLVGFFSICGQGGSVGRNHMGDIVKPLFFLKYAALNQVLKPFGLNIKITTEKFHA